MGFLKWIRENNVSTNSSNNNHKRRQSEPILIRKNYEIKKKTLDQEYVQALFRFNNWRFQSGTYYQDDNNNMNKNLKDKNGKYFSNKKKNDKCSLMYETPTKKLLKSFFNNRIERFSLPSFRSTDKGKSNNYDYAAFENNKNNENSMLNGSNNTTIYNDIDKVGGYDNLPVEILNTSCNGSPPIKFYRKNINPFLNYHSPTKLYKNKMSSFNDKKISDSDSSFSSKKHLYQTIINKHGEPVKYALPMLVSKNNLTQSTQSKISNATNMDNLYCATKFNENDNDYRETRTKTTRTVIVTDLDKSDGDLYHEIQEEIIYSSNNMHFFKYSENELGDGNFPKDLEYIIKYKPHDIQIFPYSVINTSGSVLQFCKVYNTKIMKLDYEETNKCFKENGSKRNIKFLSYFRHPNISLLMGISYRENNQINSLYLESFSCNLYDLIHKTDKHLEIEDIIDFTQQILNVTTYIHENSIIHSNICSHNILVSDSKKIIKLTSFELATSTIPPDGLSINDIIEDTEQSFNYYPYYINYRKQFSVHIYQAPELITTTNDYVYPVKQSDVYGVCLLVWEMLNQSIPFPLFSYSDLDTIFSTQTARLPLFEENRSELFKTMLENGLIISLDERITDIKILNEYYNEIKVKYLTRSNSKDFQIARIFNSMDNQPRTSTMKRRYKKQIEPNYMNGSINQINNDNVNSDMYQVCENKENSFKKLSIAQNSKILKEAWFSEEPVTNFKIITKSPKNVGRKIYNLNIRITPKNDSNQSPVINDYGTNSRNICHDGKCLLNPSDVAQNKIENSSLNDEKLDQNQKNISKKINFWNSVNISPENNEFEKVPNKSQSEENQSINDIKDRNNILNKYYPAMPELLSETFHKNSSNKSFEDSQWKQEMKICEAQFEQNKIDSEKQISVKDAIHKFELISNSPGDRSISYKKINMDNTFKSNIDLNNDETTFESNLNVTLKSPRTKTESITNKDISEFLNENDSNVKKDPPKFINKNNVIIKKVSLEMLNDNDKISPKISLNVNKLRNFPLQTSERHSICNPEVFEKLASNFLNVENRSVKPNSKFLKRPNIAAMQNLKCWNCGKNVFYINSESNPRSSSEFSTCQEPKSIEDLYIDDEFVQNIELGANMELHSKIFDAYL